MALEPFLKYSPLETDEIRLVRIQLDDNEVLQCTLATEPLDANKVAFRALSYVWGDASDRVNISCDGQSLAITRNLHAALSQLRRKGYDWLIWIDAICINQQDEEEKSAQVKLMGTIFKQAEIVLIWLGEALPTDREGLGLMGRVGDVVVELENQEGVLNYELDMNGLGLSGLEDPAWESVAKVMNRPWFHRIWIIQELLQARESVMLCGDLEIPTRAILKFADLFQYCRTIRLIFDIHQISFIPTAHLLHLNGQYTRRGDLRLLEMLLWTRTFESTDPRDRVYGLLSLTSDLPKDFINYSISYREVLIKLGTIMLTDEDLLGRENMYRLSSTIDNLCYAAPRGQSLDLPSWVPDWQLPSTEYTNLSPLVHNQVDKSKESVTVSSDESLIVQGVLLDNILTMLRDPPHSIAAKARLPNMPALLHKWHKSTLDLANTSSAYDDPLDAHRRTICFDGGPECTWDYSSTKVAYEVWARLIAIHPTSAESDGDSIQSSAAESADISDMVARSEPFVSTFNQFVSGRIFIQTSQGYLGWVASAAEVGDHIVSFHGSSLLYCLRKVAGGWKLIADCYVGGLMGGAAAEARIEGKEEMEFRIL